MKLYSFGFLVMFNMHFRGIFKMHTQLSITSINMKFQQMVKLALTHLIVGQV